MQLAQLLLHFAVTKPFCLAASKVGIHMHSRSPAECDSRMSELIWVAGKMASTLWVAVLVPLAEAAAIFSGSCTSDLSG